MNREILFRGNRVTGSGFTYGSLVVDKATSRCFISSNHVYINDIDVTCTNVYEVIPETIGQFTGLTDKNGVKIFEGDILKTETGGIGYVVWEDAAFAIKSPGSEAIDWVHSSEYAKCEVIGNINDNPELIK